MSNSIVQGKDTSNQPLDINAELLRSQNSLAVKVNNDGFTASNYTGDLAVSGTASSDAIPSSVTKVMIEGGATQDLHILFGADQAEAETVTASTGIKITAGKDKILHIPSAATYIGFIAGGADTINVTYGI